jgi:hypothetical protein
VAAANAFVSQFGQANGQMPSLAAQLSAAMESDGKRKEESASSDAAKKKPSTEKAVREQSCLITEKQSKQQISKLAKFVPKLFA